MILLKIFPLVAALAPSASAHDGIGLPRILGLDNLDQKTNTFINSLKTRGLLGNDAHSNPALEARDSPRECGEGIGTCPQDKCCSIVGCMWYHFSTFI